MSHNKKHSAGVSAIGLLLIILGAVWILNNLEMIDFELRVWWPLILIVLGLIHLTSHRRITDPGPWILIILGVIFLLTTNEIIAWDDIWKYWPVILIIIGLSIIFQRHGVRKPHKSCVDDGDWPETPGDGRITASAIFSGIEKKVSDKNFKGGSISALFGGVEIDLRSAELDEKGAVLNASAIFGGVDIWIPDSWAIELHPTAILGGVSIKTSNEAKTSGKRLVIKASAILGGVDIKN